MLYSATYQVEAKTLSCEAKQLSLTNKSLESEIKEIKKEITKKDESIKQVKTRKEKEKVLLFGTYSLFIYYKIGFSRFCQY